MEVLTETSRKAELGKSPPRLTLGEVVVDVESRRVSAPGGVHSLEPRVFDLLRTLAGRPGLTVTREHLIDMVWGRAEGSDEALSQAVAKLRRALGDDARAPRFIETVPKLGYRWIFEEPPRPPIRRWSLGPAWVAASAGLALLAGGAGGLGAYAWAKSGEPRGFEIRKVRMERGPDGRCLKRVQVIRGRGEPSEAQRAPPAPSSPGCEPREFVER